MLSINTSGLSYAKIYTQRASRNLDSARRKLLSINVPSDFAYGGKLKSLASRVSGIRAKTNSAGNWIDQAVSNFNRAESSNASLINSLLSGLTIKRLKSNSIFNKASKANMTLADKFINAQIKINGAGLAIISSIGSYIGKNIKNFSEGDIKGTKDSIGNLIKKGIYIGGKIQSMAGKLPKTTVLSIKALDSGQIKNTANSSTIMNIPNFYQNNQKINFKNPEHEARTNEHVNGFGDTGCGITSVAMVLSYLTDEKVSIQDVVDWCDDPKYGDTYFNGHGSTGEIFQGAADHWNVGNVEITTDKEEAKKALQEGRPVKKKKKKGQFTNGQHFIVLTGINQVKDDEGQTNYNVNINNPRSDRPETPDKIFDFDLDVDNTNISYYIFDAKPEKVSLE